jgi:hypothetical protein
MASLLHHFARRFAKLAKEVTGDNRNSRLATFRIPDPTTK